MICIYVCVALHLSCYLQSSSEPDSWRWPTHDHVIQVCWTGTDKARYVYIYMCIYIYPSSYAYAVLSNLLHTRNHKYVLYVSTCILSPRHVQQVVPYSTTKNLRKRRPTLKTRPWRRTTGTMRTGAQIRPKPSTRRL